MKVDKCDTKMLEIGENYLVRRQDGTWRKYLKFNKLS